MKKIYTLEQLHDLLDKDYAWRRKELAFLVSNIKSGKGPALKTALRAGVALLYAHWEGFIKNAAIYYLTFVATKQLKYEELSNCFIALSLKEKLTLCENTNKSTIHTQVVEFIMDHSSEIANLPTENVIKTGSNLNSEILREILTTIGLDFSRYELKKNLIDAELLDKRNNVAHGEHIKIDVKEFSNLYSQITNIMYNIKTDISNAACQKQYENRNSSIIV